MRLLLLTISVVLLCFSTSFATVDIDGVASANIDGVDAASVDGVAAGSSCDSVETNTILSSSQIESQIYYADSWLTTLEFDVCQVDLIVDLADAATDDFVLEIRADNGGEPAATVLATSDTILNADMPTDGSSVSFVFSTLATLADATVYWHVLKRTGTTSSEVIDVHYGNGAAEMMLGSDTGATGSWTETKTGKAWLFDHYGD